MRIGKIQERIIFEDRALIVCHKPAGIAVQNARIGVQDLESMLKNYLASKNEDPYLAVIHRLDQPVEGILVFAKKPSAAKEMNRQLNASEMTKEYLAVTTAKPKEQSGELVDYLVKDSKSNMSRVVSEKDKMAKKAVLNYRLVEEISDGDKTRYLIGIQLKTGRHHQIRVQMAHAGMPLLGDRKYNSQEDTSFSLGLCAIHLAFRHPLNKKKMDFTIKPEGEVFWHHSKDFVKKQLSGFMEC